MNLNKPKAAIFLAYYSIGKSSPVMCLIEFLSINYSIDLHLFNGRHLDSPIIEKINNIFQYENKYKDTNLVPENRTNKYDVYIALDANGFVLCKTLFPNSKPFYYSLELYFRDNFFNLHYPKEIMEIEHKEINNISGLIIQSVERENYFREEYNLKPNIPTFHLPVTYNEKSNRIKSDYLRKRFNIDNNKKILLHLGGIVDFHCLLEIAESFKNIGDWVLIIHGTGNENYKNSIKAVVQKYKINNVIISGEYFEDIGELDKILQSADAGLVWYKDVSPNFSTAGKSSGKISAYLRFGLPIVANYYKSTKEAIEDSECGYCVDNFDDIQYALTKIQNKYDYFRNNCIDIYDKIYWFGNYTDSLNIFIDRNVKGIRLQDTNNDMFLNIKLNYDNIDKYYIRTSIKQAIDNNLHQFKGIFLDLGCGEMPYKEYIQSNSEISKYIGLDIENPTYQKNIKPDVFWNGKIIPFDDKSVDTLMATEVFEHLPNIDEVLKEIFRVLKPSGKLFFTVPFLWPLHDVPYDEYRYTPYSLERHLKLAMFEGIEIKATGGWNASLAQMIGLWLKRSGLDQNESKKYFKELFPFYDYLIKNDKVPEKFNSQVFPPSFYGIANKSIHSRNNEKAVQEIANVEKKKMKIVIIQGGFPAVSATFILDQITGLIDRGLEVENWATYDTGTDVIHENIKKYEIMKVTKYIKSPDDIYKNDTTKWIQNFESINCIDYLDDISTFHVHYGVNFNKFEPLFRQTNKRILVSFHGYDASRYFLQNGNDCYNYLFERANQITTPSHHMKNELIKRGCASNKIVVHRCGIDINKFSHDNRSFSKSKIIFLTVGRFVEKKGIEYSLKAFSKICRIINSEYRIIGEGDLLDNYKKIIFDENIEDYVKLLGPKTTDEVIQEMRNSDVFVLTSIVANDGDTEGLPVSLIESHSIGLPVISTYHVGIPELVIHGRTGLLSNEKDIDDIAKNMLALAKDDKMRREFSSNCINRVNNEFDINILNDKLSNLIQNIEPLSIQFDLNSKLELVQWKYKLPLYLTAFSYFVSLTEVRNPSISVIVISWRYNSDILANLQTLQKQRKQNFELIFVDNGGYDGEFEILMPYIDTYVKLNTNSGAYLARNIGAVFAKSEILLFLDDDCHPKENLIESHVELFSSYDIIACRGAVFPKTNNPLNKIAQHYYLGENEIPIYADIEGNTSYSTDKFFKVGGWDDDIQFGGGGVDLSIRLTKIEPDLRKQIYSPKPIIYHDFAKDENHLDEKRKRQAKSRIKLKAKHENWDDFLMNYDKLSNVLNPISKKSQKSPFISICIPTYNRANYIGEAIQSVLNQSYENYEIVIVDDGSTDNTKEIIDSFKSGKIRYFYKVNTGAPETRNKCVEESRGEFILWLDSDDYLDRYTLITYVEELNKTPDADIYYGQLQSVGKSAHLYKYSDWYKNNEGMKAFLYIGSPIPHGGTLLRKSIYREIGLYNTAFQRAHDYELWSRIVISNKFNAKYVNKIIYYYRIHNNNITGELKGSTDYRYECTILRNVIEKVGFQKLFPNMDWTNSYNNCMQNVLYKTSIKFFNWNDITSGIENLIKSFDYGVSPEQNELLRQILAIKNIDKVVPEMYDKLCLLRQNPSINNNRINKGEVIGNNSTSENTNNYTQRKLIFPESKLAHYYLDGLKGIEIGASSHNPFGLNTKFVGMKDEIYEQEQLKLVGYAYPIDIEAQADNLPIQDESEDFVLTSHVIEHCPDFIKAMIEWYRVVKVGGFIYMITPKRDAAPSDRTKPLTNWDHLFDDYKNEMTAEKEPQAGRLGHCHYHVFTIDNMKTFVYNIFGSRLILVDEQETDDKNGSGFTLVYKKVVLVNNDIPWVISKDHDRIKINIKRTSNFNYDASKFVNIGMVTYNRLDYTKKSIDSVIKYSSFPYVLTVIDNNSQDGSKEYLTDLMNRGVIKNLILLDENVGVAKASNLAWFTEPNAEYYLKLDNDIVIEKPNWLENMVEVITKVPNAGVVAYNFEPYTYPVQSINGLKVRIKQRGNLGGACILIPKRTHNILGYWSEEYGLYGEEDADYGYRIILSSLLNVYLEDEDIGFHLPSGKAAVIDINTLVANDELELKNEKEYRLWKDEQRRLSIKSGIYSKVINEYYNRKRSLFVDSRFVKDYKLTKYTSSTNTEIRKSSISNNFDSRVSIIIPVFNKSELTKNCIESLYNFTSIKDFELIIVDNGSTDDTQFVVEDFKKKYSNIKYLKNSENLGYAKANNKGARLSNYEYILLLNNDTIVTQGWLEPLIDIVENDKRVAAVGSKLLFPNEKIQHAGVAIVKDIPFGDHLVARHLYYGYDKSAPEVNELREYQALTGACLLIRKSNYFDVGGLDEVYWNAYEDVDLCFKLRAKGYKLVYQPKSVVYHLESQSGQERLSGVENSVKRLHSKWLDKIIPDFTVRIDKKVYITNNEIKIYNAYHNAITSKSINLASIIVLTYNSSSTIENCLNSVINTLRVGDEVIIVDNNSRDNTIEIVESLIGNDRRFIIIQNNENIGFSAGTNVGIRLSKNPVVVMLNPDTIVNQYWLNNMTAKFDDKSITAVGPVSNRVAGHQRMELYPKDDLTGWTLPDVADYFNNKFTSKTVDTKLLIGFCMAVRREFIEKFGGLDENLFLGNDDLELSWRIRLNGGKLAVALDTFVFHVGQASFKTEAKSHTDKLVQESTDALYRKLVNHYGDGNVPPPMELWGIDWFKPSNPNYELSNTKISPKSNKLTSIIILAKDQYEYTKECIDSIFKYTAEPYELILVDNGSRDNIPDYFNELQQKYSNVEVITNHENVGFPKGVNQGIRASKGKYILIGNNDTIVTPGWLAAMIYQLEKSPKNGIVGPMSNNISGLQLIKDLNYSTLDEMLDYAKNLRKNNYGQVTSFPRVAFFCTLIKREVFDKIGGLDERFSPGNYEDDDFCMRAQIAGFETHIMKDLFIHHYRSRSFVGDGNDAYQQRLIRNRQIFVDKWGGTPDEIWIEGKRVNPPDLFVPL